MQTTLFPDYFALDETCCLHRAEIVMEKLAEIPLIFLDNQQERNTVLKRLSEAGVNTLAELLILPRFDVAEWDGVGRFFLHIFDEMRQEVRNNPEQLIEQWLLQRATWIFPSLPSPTTRGLCNTMFLLPLTSHLRLPKILRTNGTL